MCMLYALLHIAMIIKTNFINRIRKKQLNIKMCINENFRFITFNRYIGEIYTGLEGDTQKKYYKAIKHFKSAFLYGDEHSCYKLVDCFLALNKKK